MPNAAVRAKTARILVRLASRIDRRPNVRYTISHQSPAGWSDASDIAARAISFAGQGARRATAGLMETFDFGPYVSKGAARRARGEPTPPMKPTQTWHHRILDGLAGSHPKPPNV